MYWTTASTRGWSRREARCRHRSWLKRRSAAPFWAPTLMLRPVFHRLEPRIRAPVPICWLALLLVRVAENNSDTTWDRISHELDRLAAVTLTGPAGTVVQAAEPTDLQRAFLGACNVPAPPGSPP